jgi:hypothetical protein
MNSIRTRTSPRTEVAVGAWRVPAVLVLMSLSLMASSCAAVRINQFKQFSQAGTSYSNAVVDLLDASASPAIDTDSMELVKDRESFTTEKRKNAILDHNKALRERLLILGDLKRHARLLSSYFEVLGTLAESNAPSEVGSASEGVVQALGKLHPSIQNAEIGHASVASFVGGVTQIVVGHFKAAALESELKKRAPTIERELDLQQAALSALAEQMRVDLQAQLNQQESNDIVLPFVTDGPLPGSWSGERKQILQSQLSLASVNAAADAARKLKIAFVALAEGRFQLVDVPTLLGQISEVVSLIEKIEGKQQP